MTFLRLLPVILSFLLLAAHFYRAGQILLVLVSLCLLLLLILRQSWVPRVIQVALLLGAAEWLHTLFKIIQVRMAYEMPWTRLGLILGGVALFTLMSALVFQGRSLRQRYCGTGNNSTTT